MVFTLANRSPIRIKEFGQYCEAVFVAVFFKKSINKEYIFLHLFTIQMCYLPECSTYSSPRSLFHNKMFLEIRFLYRPGNPSGVEGLYLDVETSAVNTALPFRPRFKFSVSDPTSWLLPYFLFYRQWPLISLCFTATSRIHSEMNYW
jgi:hypothetical protein